MTIIEADTKNGLIKTFSANAFQVRSLFVDKFCKKIGIIDGKVLFKVHQAIVKTLSPIYQINIENFTN